MYEIHRLMEYYVGASAGKDLLNNERKGMTDYINQMYLALRHVLEIC